MSSTPELFILNYNGEREEDPWHVHEKLFIVLKDHLQPDTKVTQEDVVDCLDSLLPSKRDPHQEPGRKPIESFNNFFYNIWDPFHTIARQLPSTDPRQEKLVACLKFVSKTISKVAPYVEHQLAGGGMVCCERPWLGLPEFTLQEQLEFDSAYHTDCEVNKTRWGNYNSYAARITREGLENLISWGIIAMKGVWINRFRVELRHAHAKPTDTVLVHIHNEDVDMDVSIGLDWIRMVGAPLYRVGQEQRSSDTPSKSLWEEWKENVHGVVGDEGVSEETNIKAKEIEIIMGELEQRGCS